MRKLVPYVVPLLVFAAVGVFAPGFAGAQRAVAPPEPCYPVPNCLPISSIQTCNPGVPPQCCPPTDCSPTGGPPTPPDPDEATTAADQPLSDANDRVDDNGGGWS